MGACDVGSDGFRLQQGKDAVGKVKVTVNNGKDPSLVLKVTSGEARAQPLVRRVAQPRRLGSNAAFCGNARLNLQAGIKISSKESARRHHPSRGREGRRYKVDAYSNNTAVVNPFSIEAARRPKVTLEVKNELSVISFVMTAGFRRLRLRQCMWCR